MHPLVFHTNFGPIRFNVWDTAGSYFLLIGLKYLLIGSNSLYARKSHHTITIAGQERFGGLRDGYYIGGEAAMIMFDVTSRQSYCNVS